MNNTARQFNLKCVRGGSRIVVRIAPGFNVVNDEHWAAFVPKNNKGVDPYVLELKKKGSISFGKDFDNMELEQDPDTISKSKSEPITKLKADLQQSEKDKQKAQAEASEANSKAEKAEAEAKEAKAKAEKAELELDALKKEMGKTDDDTDDKGETESEAETEET